MPERLVLHVGLHKTATTALQDFLLANVKTMLPRGVMYLRLNRMRADVSPLICSQHERARAALERLMGRFDKPVLLMSDENILGLPGDVRGGELYTFAENRIRRLADQFPKLAIELFLTLRAPSAFLASLYCEYLRHNPYLEFADYVRDFDVAGFSYARTFDWLTALPRNVRVTVVPFEAAHGGGVDRVAAAILTAACGPGHGIDPASFPAAKSRASFSREELDLAATIAARADPWTAQMFLGLIDTRDRRFGATRFAPLPPATAAALDARYAAELAAFPRLAA
jgi:hypothetical protein